MSVFPSRDGEHTAHPKCRLPSFFFFWIFPGGFPVTDSALKLSVVVCAWICICMLSSLELSGARRFWILATTSALHCTSIQQRFTSPYALLGQSQCKNYHNFYTLGDRVKKLYNFYLGHHVKKLYFRMQFFYHTISRPLVFLTCGLDLREDYCNTPSFKDAPLSPFVGADTRHIAPTALSYLLRVKESTQMCYCYETKVYKLALPLLN